MGLGSKQDDHATSKECVMNNYRISCVLMVHLLALCAAVACARPANLGTVDFPTSGSPQAQAHFLRGVAALHALCVVDTARWDQATAVTAPLAAPAGNATAPPGSGVESYQALTALAQTPALFARGLAAARPSAPEAQQSLAELRTIHAQLPDKEVFGMPMGKVLEVQALEIAAAASAAQGNLDTAITTVQNAVTLEETMPPPQGPPLVIKPAHELLGEILLQAPRPADAAQQFATALYRHPNRARALLGAARAAAQRGERR